MQERSEAERRAIRPCLNVATWGRERSDLVIQQTALSVWIESICANMQSVTDIEVN